MDTSQFDVLTRVAIPIATFIIGSAITLAYKKREERRAVIRQNAEEASKNAAAWYTQLHNLYIKLKNSDSSAKADLLVYEYVRNREILPNIQRNLEVLNMHSKTHNLANAVSNFLGIVTKDSEKSFNSQNIAPLVNNIREISSPNIATESFNSFEDIYLLQCPPPKFYQSKNQENGNTNDTFVTSQKEIDDYFDEIDAYLQIVQKEAALILAE